MSLAFCSGRFERRRAIALALVVPALVCLLSTTGCRRRGEYPRRPVTLICPWAAGGGTDLVSRQLATHLERELGAPVNVVNATGGKGVTGHRRGLRARPDGYTLAMITLELNTMHWSGLTKLTYRDCRPLMSVNEDYAAVLVRGDAPWKSLHELEDRIRAEPGRLAASGTTAGGAWHLATAGWLIACGMSPDHVKWISETGAKPSLEQLNSGGVDFVCCSLPEARSMYESGQARALGIMAPTRAAGFEDVPTFAEQGTEWSLGGWRGLAVPLETPDDVHSTLVQALQRIVDGESRLPEGRGGAGASPRTFPEFMATQGFDNTSRGPDEFARFMAENDRKFGQLLTDPMMSSVNREPMNPMLFPYVLFGVIGATAAGMYASRRLARRRDRAAATADDIAAETDVDRDGDSDAERVGPAGLFRLAVAVGGVVLFALLAEQVGFVILAGALLLVTCVALGTRVWVAAALTLFVIPLTYQLFAVVLRVPLPRGWFGW